MVVGLAMSYFLRTAEFPLKEEDITAKNGAQVKGLNANSIQKRLKEHGVLGRTPVECGRTSRGTITIALELSKAINDAVGSF